MPPRSAPDLVPVTPTPGASPGSTHGPPGRDVASRLSLEWKIPLAMLGVLVVALGALTYGVHYTLTRRVESIVRDRLGHSVREIARSAEASLAQRSAMLTEAARSPAVVARLAGGAGDADAVAAMKALLSPRDTSSTVELWDAEGRPVLRAGASAPPAATRPALSAAADGATLIGPGHAIHGRLLFWVAAPVIRDGRRVGHVAQTRWIGGPPDAERMLREFTREEIRLLVRSDDGRLWSRAPGVLVPPPDRRETGAEGGLWYVRGDSGRFAAEEARVAGSPFVMVIETPERWIFLRPLRTVRGLAIASLVATVAGTLLAWALSRRLTRPLAELTRATEAVARGHYDAVLVGSRRDEIGRLEASFAAMTAEVATMRRELERRAADAQEYAAELTRANALLAEAMADAERASQAKSDFLAVMSHELRTPLNAIGGYVQLLDMDMYGALNDAQREALARVERSQRHLLTLIDDVLNYARLERGQTEYDLRSVAVGEALAAVEALVAPQARARDIALTIEPPPATLAVRADVDKLRQVLLNLVTNALKYTPQGGRVRVACTAQEHDARITVSDTGPGIATQLLGTIFEPFVQGDRALNRPSEGVGLGLAISRDLAHGMGGTLAVTSTVGEGSTFTLTLPRVGVGLPAAGRTVPSSDTLVDV